MDIDKVRALTDTELGLELATQRRHLYDLRFQLATRQLTDHSQLTDARRTIARILTVVTERSLDENELVRQATPAETRQPATRGRTRGRTAGRATAEKSAAKKPAKTPAAAKSTTSGATGGTKE
jgi:large subunit ribosomal protein L29